MEFQKQNEKNSPLELIPIEPYKFGPTLIVRVKKTEKKKVDPWAMVTFLAVLGALSAFWFKVSFLTATLGS